MYTRTTPVEKLLLRQKPLLILILAFILSFEIQSQTNAIETVLQKGHSRYVTCLSFSPDGKHIVTGSFDNTLKLWNAESGKEIRSFSQHTSFVRTVYFSPDGMRILTSSGDNKALVYDIYTGKVLVEIKIESEKLFKACFSPDGSKIITSTDRRDIDLWDAEKGEKLGTFKKSYSGSITKQWASSDGNKLLSIVDNQIQLVDLVDTLNKMKYSIEKPNAYAISPNNEYVVIGSSKKYAKIFNLESGKEIHKIDPNEEQKCDGCKTVVAFSNNSNYVVTAAKYSGVVVWDVKKGTKLKSFEVSNDWIDEVSFSPDDKYVIASADDETFLWNIKTGERIFHLTFDGLECKSVFSPDSKSLLTTNINNTAALWDINSGKKTKEFAGYLNKNRDDGLRFDQGNWYHSNIIKYLSLKSKAALSPDGKYIVKGNTDSIAFMLNLETGKIERTFVGHNKTVIYSEFSSDGKWLITASGDRTIKLWEVATGKLIRTFRGHQELVFDAKFSSDNKYIVSGSWDASMRIWEMETGKHLSYFSLDKVSPYCVDFTPNDLYLVSGDLSDKLKLWEVDAGKVFREIIGHTEIVTDICFSPDGKQMVTASLDAKVKVWDLLSGMLIKKFGKHTSGVYSVAYHPKGEFIASGSNDRSIKIWDPFTGQVLHTFTGHSGGVTSLQISDDGKTLVSCTIDGEIKVWDLTNFSELYTYIQIDRDNWLAKNPQGYFDGSADALKRINYVSGLEAIPVGSLFEKYYSPNLIRRIQEGEEFVSSTSDLQELIKNTPTVQINILPDNTINNTTIVDSIEWFTSSILLSVETIDQGGGIDELRIYNNGKLIQNVEYTKSTIRSGKKYSETLEIPILAGDNEIKAVAYNKNRTESEPTALNVFYDGVESEIDLYIFSVGINKYKNPSYELSYAIDDAKSYSNMVTKNANSIFKSVEEFFIKDNKADKKGIQNVFSEISGKAGPEDVFIFYFAGHGAMSAGNNTEKEEFYIIPYDVTKLYGDNEILKEKAISTEEILTFSKQITARKQMYILDACQAGGALTAFNTRGANREKAVAQLARSTGTFFILASGAVQYASEAKDLGHGIFTYAVLEGLKGKADGGNMDEKITANELKSYVEDRVPELTDEYMLTPQYPTGYSFGQDFPIVIVK